MEYSELICRVFDAFDENDKDFPNDIIFPILRYDFSGNIVDMFIACSPIRNLTNGQVEKIESIDDVLFYGVKNNSVDFVSLDEGEEAVFDFSKFKINDSSNDFTSLYMQAREFVFCENLTKEQKQILKSLISIYDDSNEEEVAKIYRKYGCDFYKWAYEVLCKDL